MAVTITTEKLSSAFLVVAEYLPVIIVANSSDVSGIDIPTVDASSYWCMRLKLHCLFIFAYAS